jgi:LuxR family transcriptional regulator of csgAB operon
MSQIGNHWIALLSDQNLQSNLLAYALQKELNVKVTIESHLPEFEKRVPESGQTRLLCFLDARGNHLQRVANICRTWSKAGLLSCTLALYELDHDEFAERTAIAEGVRGFFYVEDSLDTLLKGVTKLFEGEIWVPRELLYSAAQSKSSTTQTTNGVSYSLTNREMQILAHVCTGLSNDEIADNLSVSPHTVKTHLYRIFKKIRVSNRFQASLWAAKHL